MGNHGASTCETRVDKKKMDMYRPRNSGDQITALPDKLFVGTHREVDGEGSETAQLLEERHKPRHAVERSLLASAWTLSVTYVPRWNN